MAEDTNINCANLISNSTTEALLDSKMPENENSTTNSEDKEKSNMNSSSVDPNTERESPSRASPEPACSICLGGLQNKCFTDSCTHTFCFACLLEWSKVKPECPLCKVSFKSIVYNVRSNRDYDQYYVQQPYLEFETMHSVQFRRRTRGGIIDGRLQLNPIISIGIQEHRITFAPHSVRSRTTTFHEEERPRVEPRIRNLEFRRRVYDNNMWAKEIGTRQRHVSPDFYRDNPACTHRLVPWLTRELTVLLDTEHRVGFVLDFIMSIILRYAITSKEFFIHTQSYLGSRTCHFVHEFYTFASSIYDMDEYDAHVQYDTLFGNFSSTTGDVVTLVSSDSDEDFTLTIEPSSSTAAVTTTTNTIASPIQQKKKRPITKLFLKKNRDNDSWNVTYPPSSTTTTDEDLNTPSLPANPVQPSVTEPEPSEKQTPISITLSSDSEYVSDVNECVIVQELKPRWLRTPEIVNLSSDSEILVPEKSNHSGDLDLEPVSDCSLSDFISEIEKFGNSSASKDFTPRDNLPSSPDQKSKNESDDDNHCSFSSLKMLPYKKRKKLFAHCSPSRWSSSSFSSEQDLSQPFSPENSHNHWSSSKRKRRLSDDNDSCPRETSSERLKSIVVNTSKPSSSRSSEHSIEMSKKRIHSSGSRSKRHKHKKSKRKHEKHKYKKH